MIYRACFEQASWLNYTILSKLSILPEGNRAVRVFKRKIYADRMRTCSPLTVTFKTWNHAVQGYINNASPSGVSSWWIGATIVLTTLWVYRIVCDDLFQKMSIRYIYTCVSYCEYNTERKELWGKWKNSLKKFLFYMKWTCSSNCANRYTFISYLTMRTFWVTYCF